SANGCAGAITTLVSGTPISVGLPKAAGWTLGLAGGISEFVNDPTTATKTILVGAQRTGGLTFHGYAGAFDPITIAPITTDDTLVVSEGLNNITIQSGTNETGTFYYDFSSSLVAESPLFSVTITSTGGGSPSVVFSVSSYLQGQSGWNATSLQSQLTT